MKTLNAFLAALCITTLAHAEEIRIATYNVEHWADKFDTRKAVAWAKTQPQSAELDKLVKDERNQDDKDNWMVAQTILNPKLNPDILVIQEGPAQDDLEYFNKRWLEGAYKTVMVLPTNTDRDQNVCLLMKDGFKILESKFDYHKEKDTVAKDFLKKEGSEEGSVVKDNLLFARGPNFVKVQTPGGYVFWMGTNHQKSKSGNSVEVSAWRDREAKRIHAIITELAATGTDVVFGGDMNDELGFQEFEQEAGGDSIADIVGTDGKIVMTTKALAEKNEISFGGYMRDRYRSFIDHFFVSKSLADRVESVQVFKDGVAPAASDHYPVLMIIKSK